MGVRFAALVFVDGSFEVLGEPSDVELSMVIDEVEIGQDGEMDLVQVVQEDP